MKQALLAIGSVLILIGEYLTINSLAPVLVSEGRISLVGIVTIVAGLVAIVVASKDDAVKNCLLAIGGGLILIGLLSEISTLKSEGHISAIGTLALFAGFVLIIISSVIPRH
jgi:hypothetical protein